MLLITVKCTLYSSIYRLKEAFLFCFVSGRINKLVNDEVHGWTVIFRFYVEDCSESCWFIAKEF